MELLYDFTDPEATLLAHAGGKGASLARLVQAGFPVPDGFIVTARAYREFIANDKELAKEVRDLDFENADRLHKQCEVIRNRLRDTPLPDGLKACLEDSTVSLLASGPVSVRSSSTMEDLAGAAFAG